MKLLITLGILAAVGGLTYAANYTLSGQLASAEVPANDLEETAALTDRIAQFEAQNQSLSAALETAETELETTKSALESAKAEKDWLETALEAMTQRAETAEGAQTELAALQEENATLTSRVATLTTQRNNATTQLAELTEAKAVADEGAPENSEQIAAFEAELETLNAQIAELTQSVQDRDLEIKTLKAVNLVSPAPTPVLETVAPEQEMLASCQSRSDAVLASASLEFEPKSSNLTPGSLYALEALAAVAIECTNADMVLEIASQLENADSASTLLLSHARANAVFENLSANGVPSKSMRVLGYGKTLQDTDSSDPSNQRIALFWDIR